MVSRPPGPGRERALEWGPVDPGAGGGSRVRDTVGALVRTGSRVTGITIENTPAVGVVVDLLGVDTVRVRWSHGVTEVDPATLRVIG